MVLVLSGIFGCIFWFFSYGQWTFTLAPWLAFPLLYLLVQQLKKNAWPWILLLPPIFFGLFLVQWQNYIPAPRPIYQFVAAGYAILLSIPWLLLRFFPRIVFPIGYVILECLLAYLSPYGSWGSLVYSQRELPSSLQALSLFGFVGYVSLLYFSLYSLGEVLRTIIEGCRLPHKLLAFAGVLLTIFLAGHLKYAFRNKPVTSIPVAGIVEPLTNSSIIFAELDYKRSFPENELFVGLYLLNQTIPAEAAEKVERWFSSVQEGLEKKTRAAARAGARLVVWSEGNGVVWKSREQEWLSRLAVLAREEKIYLLASLNVKQPGKLLTENKVVVWDPSGKNLGVFLKSRPVPGAENSIPGGTDPFVFQTEWGNIAIAVCFDADFPFWVARIPANSRIRALVVPAFDWEAITPFHTEMAKMRAIEGGFSLLRVANQGLSAVYTPYGEKYSSSMESLSQTKLFLSEIPLY